VKHICIVHYLGATAKSLSVVASLATDMAQEGNTVEVLDLKPTTTIAQGYPPALLVRSVGHRVFPDAFPHALQESDVSYRELPTTKKPHPIRKDHQEPLRVAIESELLTYFRLDHIPATPEAIKLRESLEKNMELTYTSLWELWSTRPPTEVLIPNGRTSRQKAARLVAEALGIPVHLYENGRARPNSYYLGSTQPHDRLASQKEVPTTTSTLTEETIEELASTWLTSRMAGSAGTNSFSSSWDQAKESTQTSRVKKKAVFFASSFDEFLAFGPMWTIDEWSSQFEAFDLIMGILEKQGVELILRLHPNLGSKSRKYFSREVNDILALQRRHPGLSIHWHNSTANSYQLVADADYVIVERSTIGLEASLMGKPVWVTQAAQWDLVADVRSIHRPQDITPESLVPWEPSPAGAKRFVAYWMIQEHPLHYSWSDWSTWDPEKAPLLLKLLHLALPNSLRHKMRLISLEISKIRNSRFRPPARIAKNE
jgi:hypothetical protein